MSHGKSPKHTRKPHKKRAVRPEVTAKARPRQKMRTASTGEVGHVDLGGSVRLQKLLAGAGFGSRREVEQFMVEQRVTVNGRLANLGDRADPSVDDIRLDGERLVRECVIDRSADDVDYGLFGGTNRPTVVAQDLLRDFLGLRHQIVVGHGECYVRDLVALFV